MISMLAVLPAAPPLCVCVHWALRLGWEGRDGNVITQCEPNPVRMRDQFCQNGVWEGGSLQAAWVAWSVGCWSSSCSFFVCLSISSADGLQQECFWLHISQVLGESLQIRKIIHSIVIHNAIVCHVIVCHVYVNVYARACLSRKNCRDPCELHCVRLWNESNPGSYWVTDTLLMTRDWKNMLSASTTEWMLF